jgi:hypothetical protein
MLSRLPSRHESESVQWHPISFTQVALCTQAKQLYMQMKAYDDYYCTGKSMGVFDKNRFLFTVAATPCDRTVTKQRLAVMNS